MLTDTLIRTPRTTGLTLLHRRATHPLSAELSSWRIRLEPGQSVTHTVDGEEMVVVLQDGRGTFSVNGHGWDLSRKNVFAERASAVYAPPGSRLTVTASTALEAIAVSTPAPTTGAPAAVSPDDVQVHARGKGHYAREVHDIFVRDSHAQRLLVGETFNPPGHWSSFPPHKHDGRDGEPVLEEVYHFRVSPPQGFGQQLLYTADGESVTHTVRDGDVVLLPYGYHPVCSPPGYQLYYLWAMAGAERRLAVYEDPAHRWIHDAP